MTNSIDLSEKAKTIFWKTLSDKTTFSNKWLPVISQQVAFLEKFHSKLEKFHSKFENFHSKLEKFQSTNSLKNDRVL